MPRAARIGLGAAGLALVAVATFTRQWALAASAWVLVLAGAAWLAQVATAKPESLRFAVVDLETTGLEIGSNRVIEVAVVHAGGDGSIGEPRSWLIRPEDGSFGGEDIHHISEQQLADSPTFAEVGDEILASLEGRTLVAHNAAFDWGFLNAEFDRAERFADDQRRPLTYVCTARLARTAGLRPLRLAAVCEQLGVDGPENAHRAGDDALACARTLQPLLKRLGVSDLSRF
jgi:DNA polymerase-3 subunit epsilon